MPLKKSELRLLRAATKRIPLTDEDADKAVSLLRGCMNDAKKIRSRIAVLKTYADLERINSEEHIATMKMLSEVFGNRKAQGDDNPIGDDEVGHGLESLVELARRDAAAIAASGQPQNDGSGSPLVLPLADNGESRPVAEGGVVRYDEQLDPERKPAVG